MARPVIVGITGASGIVYGVRALQLLRECNIPTHLVMSKSAELTLHYEMDMSLSELQALASEVHPVKHVGASIASGSFPTAGIRGRSSGWLLCFSVGHFRQLGRPEGQRQGWRYRDPCEDGQRAVEHLSARAGGQPTTRNFS